MKVVEVPVPPVGLPSLHHGCLAVSALDRQLEEAVLRDGARLRDNGEVRNGDVEGHHV